MQGQTIRKQKETKMIHIGSVPVGGGAPVTVQSMTNTDTRDVNATLAQIERLEEAGCEIIRLAVPDDSAASALSEICSRVKIPVIADIHFDYRLAVASVKAGAGGLRINPGNIGGKKAVGEVVAAARDTGAPIRIGVNSGSIQKEILLKYSHPTPEAMVESAVEYIHMLEDFDFDLIKVSLKSSHVMNTIKAYELLSSQVDYPLHLGVTEAGTLVAGTVKSALGIGMLLAEGIGDTFRVSLTGDPVLEVRVGYELLRALDLRHRGPEIISCPTCGRTEIDLFQLVEKVEKAVCHLPIALKIAIMGCVVNGPGEAREADIGVAGGRGTGILFKKGKVTRKIPEEELADALIREVMEMAGLQNK
ncbi:MAG: flavodoxin-dependent (E)-4-hydroxy-3-methylbut-2-enyl-diphosphate synthase [Desulfatiglandaceae bacterium]